MKTETDIPMGYPVRPGDIGKCPRCWGAVMDNRRIKCCHWCGRRFKKFPVDRVGNLRIQLAVAMSERSDGGDNEN